MVKIAQQKIIKGYLAELGVVKVSFARTGKQALAALQEHNPDLVISAMHLEDMTGTDLVLKIRTGDLNRDIPYMLISSEGQTFHEFIPKFENTCEFLEKVTNTFSQNSNEYILINMYICKISDYFKTLH